MPVTVPFYASAIALVLNEFKTTKGIEKYLEGVERILYVARLTRLIIILTTYIVVCLPFVVLIAFWGTRQIIFPFI